MAVATYSKRALTAIGKDEMARLLLTMLRIRRFEEAAAAQYAAGEIRGLLHLSTGQEAVAAGITSRLADGDYVFAPHRAHGHALARGLAMRAVMAELLGKATGVSKGRGGSMHLFDVSRRFMGGYGVVGSQLPIACGSALACQRAGGEDVVLCIFGDGAVNEGAFHEALNLASVWKLPVLFLCENNFYAFGTAAASVSALTDIHRRAEAYGIRAEQVDGMDVLATRQLAIDALQYVRTGQGPFFIEAQTYRFEGHTPDDPQLYRDASEVAQWQALDPLVRLRELMLGSGLFAAAELDALVRLAEAEVADAVAYALASPEPAAETLYDNLYAPSTADASA